MDRATQQAYAGFMLAWMERPPATGEWQVRIHSNSPHLQKELEEYVGAKGPYAIGAYTLDDAIARAKSLVDKLVL